MENEAQHYLTEVARVRNVAKDGDQVVKAKHYLKHHEREAKLVEMGQIDRVLRPGNFAAHGTIGDEGRALLAKRKHALSKQLLEGSPPTDLQGETKDALSKRQQQLEDAIKVGMPTHEEMRRNPAGAVDKHRKWEKANKDRILERQNILHVLNPDDDSKDLTNIDMLRPHAAPTGAATFMADAQIPGHFAMTAQAKENWPEKMPEYGTVDSPLKQAEKREAKERTPLGEPKVDTVLKAAQRNETMLSEAPKERTPAQLAHAEKMKAKFAAMREAKNV